MVRKENIQARGNSLLQTATSKRAGPGRFASLVLRGTAKPPVKKVNVTTSDASRVSDMTASIVEDARPAVIKEVKIDDFDVESSVLEMSVKSGNSALKAFAQESPLIGHQEKTTPQPPSFRLPPRKDAKPMEKRLMEIQPGIRITFPSPMSLDRIQVQMGQEHAAPASAEYIRLEEEKRCLEEIQRQREEKTEAKKEEARKLKEDLHKEIGEGFEALLEDEPEETTPAKKKSLVSKILGKIRPKSPKKTMTADVARAMAREAIARSKNSKGLGKPPLPKRGDIPLQEITMSGKEDSVSDLDSSGKRNFPVREILMSDGGDSRDDESISTLGTAHILERMRPMGSSILFPGRDGGVRDPSPFHDFEPMDATEMFHPPPPKPRAHALGTNALLDQIDSGSLTEDAGELTGAFGRCGPLGQPKVSRTAISKQSGLGLAAVCIHQDALKNCNRQSGCPHEENDDNPTIKETTASPHEENEDSPSMNETIGRKRNLEPPESGAKSEVSQTSPGEKISSVLDAVISSVEIGMKGRQSLDARGDSITDEVSHVSSIDIKKTLSPIDEEFSPINREQAAALNSMPELEEDKDEVPMRTGTNEIEGGDVIDLTDLASPMSPTTQDGVKGDKGAVKGAFSFENLMDLAASRLKWNAGDDRYAVEGEESPQHVIRGQSVESDIADGSSIPVVQGVEISRKKNLRNEITPKASGGSRSPKQPSSSLHSSTIKPPHALASEVSPQSSFEVYEHPEGDIVMWSENPIQARHAPKTQTPTPNGYTGHFSDGLFDLLSMDESVSRGRKKVPFLSVNNNDRQVVGTNTDSTSEISKNVEDSNSQALMTMSTEASDKRIEKDEKSEDSLDKEMGEQHETMDPSLGIMCGAVPLYFMYKSRNSSNKTDSDSTKTEKLETFEDGKDNAVEVQDSAPFAKVEEERTVSPKPQPKGFLPMASPKKGNFTLHTRNDIPTKNPSNDDNIKDTATSSAEEQKEPEPKVREKVLLDHDDAYWDTLSTIASSKDKRSGSGDVFTALAEDPGPIPIEITMNASNPSDGVSSRNSSSTLSEDKRRTTGYVIDMVSDEKSSDSLSRQLNNLFAEREVPVYSEVKYTDGINEVRLLGKARTANVRDAFHDQHWHGPPQELDQSPAEYSSKQEAGKSERRNVSDGNREFASRNLATNILDQRNSYLELGPSHRGYSTSARNNGASAKAGKSGRDDVSDDNSGLLLAITRTEGDDDDKSSKVESHTSRNETHDMWSRADLDEILIKAMQDQSCNDFYDGAKEVFEEATSHIVSTQNTTAWSQPKIQHQAKSIGTIHDQSCNDFYNGAKEVLEVATSHIVSTQNTDAWSQSKTQYQVKSIGPIQKREEKLCDDFYDEAKAALDEATAYIVPTQGNMAWPKPDQQRSNRSIRMAPENDRRGRGALKSYPPKTNTAMPSTHAALVTSKAPSIPDDYVPRSFGDVLNANSLPNPWNSSTRSVSWGFEEIYEEAEEVASDDPQQVEPLPGTEGNRNKAIMTAAAEAAATTAALGQINTPIVEQPGSSGSESNMLSDIDEEELISRTLQLSKQLLASMTLHDLEGADNDVVKSLMSFGTEDGRFSLPEISRDGQRESPPRPKDPPRASLFTDSSSDEETATQDKSSLAVVDPAEAAVRTAIPESVRVSKPASMSARVLGSTAGDAVSFARSLDVNAPQTSFHSDKTSVRSRTSSPINPQGSFSAKSWNRSHSESIDQAPPTSVLDDKTQMNTSHVSASMQYKPKAIALSPTPPLNPSSSLSTSHGIVASSTSLSTTSKVNRSSTPASLRLSTAPPMNPSTSFSTSHGIVASPTSQSTTSKANGSPTLSSLRHVNSIPETDVSSNHELFDFSESQALVLSPSSSMQVRSMNASPSSIRRLGSSTNSPTNVASHQDESSGFSELFGLSLFHSRQEIRSMNDDSMTPTSILRRLGSTPQELSSGESSRFSPLSGLSGTSPMELDVSETSHSETLQGSHTVTSGGAVQQPAIFHVLNRLTRKEMMHHHQADEEGEEQQQQQQQPNYPVMQRRGEDPIGSISGGNSHTSSNKQVISESTISTTTSQGRLSSEGESHQDDSSTPGGAGLGQNLDQELQSSFTPSSNNPSMPMEEETSSLRPTGSGMTEDSPIDVESLFNKYDNLAHHLIEENANLKERALMTGGGDGSSSTGGDEVDSGGDMDEKLTAVSSNSSFNVVLSRLDQLRAQREKAVAVLQKNSANRPTDGSRVQGGSVSAVGGNTNIPREKNRLNHYTTRPSNSSKSLMMMDLSGMEQPESPSSGALAVHHAPTTSTTTGTGQQQQQQQQQQRRGAGAGPPDIETSSTSSDRTTPSMKARELRRQLDEALQASHTIRKSQEQLGRELATFKSRFYRKSEELEEQAFRAIGGI